ncbi:MAG: response regulator [Verrucomicrobiales bacterium]|nr:response regulator [Verrucomicrobiales bacterium]
MNSPHPNPTGLPPLVYLVDDEPLLLELAEMVLEGNGYRFQKFQDPTEAWSAFAVADPAPALLITDYAMHAMNGVELIVKCKQLHPELKTILISGTVDESILRHVPMKVDHFLRKPYRTTELGNIVRSVLS